MQMYSPASESKNIFVLDLHALNWFPKLLGQTKLRMFGFSFDFYFGLLSYSMAWWDILTQSFFITHSIISRKLIEIFWFFRFKDSWIKEYGKRNTRLFTTAIIWKKIYEIILVRINRPYYKRSLSGDIFLFLKYYLIELAVK